MFRSFTTNLFNCTQNSKQLPFIISRANSTFERVFDVPTFCNLNINLSCNILLKHLDVHKFPNCDKVIINVKEPDRFDVTHSQVGNNIKIEGISKDINNKTCEISAPIKANLNVTSSMGDINVDYFDNDCMILKALKGDININTFQGKKLKADTVTGNVCFKNAIRATDIEVSVGKTGSIKTSRLQAMKALFKTNVGNISVESSYCNECSYEVTQGNLNLSNVHKDCKAIIHNTGNLKMTGLDGRLQALLNNGSADIQLSRILDHSEIIVQNKGDVTLRLAKGCQEQNSLELTSKEINVDDNVRMIKSKADNTVYLSSLSDTGKILVVDCKNGIINVHSASWADMLFVNRNTK